MVPSHFMTKSLRFLQKSQKYFKSSNPKVKVTYLKCKFEVLVGLLSDFVVGCRCQITEHRQEKSLSTSFKHEKNALKSKTQFK